MSNACLLAGFGLLAVGLYLVAGLGWACIGVGAVLFLAGGLIVMQDERKAAKR